MKFRLLQSLISLKKKVDRLHAIRRGIWKCSCRLTVSFSVLFFFPLDALKQARKGILEEILIVRLILTTEIQIWNENRDTLTNSSS